MSQKQLSHPDTAHNRIFRLLSVLIASWSLARYLQASIRFVSLREDDVAYSYNPSGGWTSQHQLSLAGKRDGFSVDDLLDFASLGDEKNDTSKENPI